MTRFLQAGRWRRAAILCCASALLHVLAVNWLGGYLTAPSEAGMRGAPIAPIVASLHVEPATAAQEMAPVPQKASVRAAASDMPAAQAKLDAQRNEAHGYQVALPPSAELSYDVSRVDERGEAQQGEGLLIWQREAGSYRLERRASVAHDPVLALFELASTGRIGAAGIEPQTFREQRRGRSTVATHFEKERGLILFSAASAPVAWTAGAQDSVSFLLQLAGIANADRAQLTRGIEMLLAGGREAQAVRLLVGGEEEIETGMGRMATWRVQRPVPDGSYNAYLEIWLAPDYHWYPVQLRSTDANGAVTTHTVRRIVIKEN